MNSKYLYIISGAPGSGKTSLAKSLGFPYFEADQYFTKDGVYNFDASKLRAAHESCINRLEEFMQVSCNYTCDRLIVSNTSTRESELKPYINLANRYGYQIFFFVLENRHGGVSIHNLPEGKAEEMADRLMKRIKLI